MTDLQTPLLTKREAARHLRICTRKLETLIAAGFGPPRVRIGHRTFFHERDFVAWLERRTERPATVRPDTTT